MSKGGADAEIMNEIFREIMEKSVGET